jgi:5'-nucleotidase
MRILLTNDDGIVAPGLYALYEVFKEDHEVYIVAPESEQSAVGHAITLSNPLRVKEIYRDSLFYGYAINGTPADAVKIAVNELLSSPLNMVISGINLGPNVGINVLYSGTVSAATEAAILGIPSIALSLNTYKKADFTPAAVFAKKLVEKSLTIKWPQGASLNINIPALPLEKIKAIAITHQATIALRDRFEKRVDPRHHVYYWEGDDGFLNRPPPGTDIYALSEDKISITPLNYDLTHYPSIKVFRDSNLFSISIF